MDSILEELIYFMFRYEKAITLFTLNSEFSKTFYFINLTNLFFEVFTVFTLTFTTNCFLPNESASDFI